MDNYEIVDNIFQTMSLMTVMIVSCAAGLKHSSRKLVVLACAYGSIMLGTLFLHAPSYHHRRHPADILCI